MTDSGWRKRQIALDKKAENARELGLDYEPNKTVIEMAQTTLLRMNTVDNESVFWTATDEELEAFAKLVREDEREKFLGVLRQLHDSYSLASDPTAIRKREQSPATPDIGYMFGDKR
jgi:hypothetical protein